MLALATTSIAWIILGDRRRRLDRLRLRSTPASARQEVGSEIELAAEPQAVLRRRGARGPAPRARPAASACCCSSSSSSACRCTGCSSRAARPAPPRASRSGSPAGVADLFAPTADGGFNCAGCHGGMNATGGERAVHGHRPGHRRGRVRQLDGAGAEHRALPLRRATRSRYILTYGRPGSPMSAWGLDGGGPMNAQQIDTLIEYLKSIQIPREDCMPEEEGDPLCPSGHLPADDPGRHRDARPAVRRGRHVRHATARRCSTSTSAAAPTAAPAATPRAGATAIPACPGQGAFGWNLTGGSTDAPVPEHRGHDRVRRRPAR